MSLSALWDLLGDAEPSRVQQGLELAAAIPSAERRVLFADLFGAGGRRLPRRVPESRVAARRLSRWLALPVSAQPGSPAGLWQTAGPEAGTSRWLRLDAPGGIAATALVSGPAEAQQVQTWLGAAAAGRASVGLWAAPPETAEVQVIVFLLGRVTLLRGGLHTDGGLRLRTLSLSHNLSTMSTYQRAT